VVPARPCQEPVAVSSAPARVVAGVAPAPLPLPALPSMPPGATSTAPVGAWAAVAALVPLVAAAAAQTEPPIPVLETVCLLTAEVLDTVAAATPDAVLPEAPQQVVPQEPDEAAEDTGQALQQGEPALCLPHFEPPDWNLLPLPVPESPSDGPEGPKPVRQCHFAEAFEVRSVDGSVQVEEKLWLDLTSLEEDGGDVSTATGLNVSAPPSTFTYCYSVSDSGSDTVQSEGSSSEAEGGGTLNEPLSWMRQEESAAYSPTSEAWSPMSMEACSPISGRMCSAPDPANVPRPFHLALKAASVAAAYQGGADAGGGIPQLSPASLPSISYNSRALFAHGSPTEALGAFNWNSIKHPERLEV